MDQQSVVQIVKGKGRSHTVCCGVVRTHISVNVILVLNEFDYNDRCIVVWMHACPHGNGMSAHSVN